MFYRLHVQCDKDAIVHIYRNRNEVQNFMDTVAKQERRKRDEKLPCSDYNFDIISETVRGITYYNTNVSI